MTLDNMKLQDNHDGTYRCSGVTNLIDNDGNECGKLHVDAYRCTIPDDLSDSFRRLAEAMIAAAESEKRIEKLREDVFNDALNMIKDNHPELDITDIERKARKEFGIGGNKYD